MGLNIHQLSVAGVARPPAASEQATRGPLRRTDEATPSAATDLPRAAKPGEPVSPNQSASPPEGDPAVPPAALDRAVEEANQLSESLLRATNRRVSFNRDQETGRVIITIREERNGQEVQRQIPPDEMLQVLERLRDATQNQSRGKLVDFAI